MTFPSIVRRSLIINCKGRFVSAQRLASLLSDIQVFFLMQEDMNDFVTSQPAAGAQFTIVLGELCDFSVATFQQQIERYAEGGGDGGLTRAACGLPAEGVALHQGGAGHVVAPRPGAAAASCECRDQGLDPREGPPRKGDQPKNWRATDPRTGGPRTGPCVRCPFAATF